MSVETEDRKNGELSLESLQRENAVLRSQLNELKEKLWCSECELPRGGQISDRDIKRLLLSKRIVIDPLPDLEDPSILGTCKIDLSLGKTAKVLNPNKIPYIDFAEPIPEEYYDHFDVQKAGKLVLAANSVVIATTMEWVTLPEDISGRLEGKSGIARRKLGVEDAPVFDAGWSGLPVLELFLKGHAGVLHYGQPICSMSFEHMTSPTLKEYAQREGVHYSTQTRAQT